MSNILIIGSGPVAIQLAQLCNRVSKNHIDMVGRASTSKKSLDVYQSYQQAGTFTVTTQNDTHHQFAGQFQIRHFYQDIQQIDESYDTIILACTADAYRPMLQQLALTILQHVKHMILVSPTFGSHMMIEQLLADINTDVEVISFSTYLGDTRVVDTSQPHRVLTTAVKSKIFV